MKWLKKSIYNKKVDQIQYILIIFWYKLNLTIYLWFKFESKRANRTAEIGSKKLIKRRFESDLKQILAWGRLDHISLIIWTSDLRYALSSLTTVFKFDYVLAINDSRV